MTYKERSSTTKTHKNHAKDIRHPHPSQDAPIHGVTKGKARHIQHFSPFTTFYIYHLFTSFLYPVATIATTTAINYNLDAKSSMLRVGYLATNAISRSPRP